MGAILFVEDESSLRTALRFDLRELGDLIEAKDLPDALQKVDELLSAQKPLGLAIVDLQLPTANGIEPDAGFQVVERLLEAYSDTAVIILTIRNDRPAWPRAQQYPSVRYFFTKPASSDALLVAAKTCLKADPSGPILMGTIEGEQP